MDDYKKPLKYDDDSSAERELHETALKQYDDIYSIYQRERETSLEDRRFYSIAGAQWEGNLADIFENKPKFEVNKTHLAVMRIINEYRNNRITVNFVSKDGGAQQDKLADVLQGLYRADEQDSVADEAYDNAFEEAVAGGFGAWRLTHKLENEEDEDDDRQRIFIEPIFDADQTVFFDPDAERQDKSDAKYCFLLRSMSPDKYKEMFDDEPASWPKIENMKTTFDWNTKDNVYVAEYYKVEETTKTFQIWKDINNEEMKFDVQELKDDPEIVRELRATGASFVSKKKIKTTKVRKYILSGGGLLEDCGYIAGKHIPIVPVYGKRIIVDAIERCIGAVRYLKDPQRIKNMQLSKLAEISAISSVEKPIVTPEQISGHQNLWAEDNIKNYPYLLLNPITDATGQQVPSGPVGYTKSPQIPPALAGLLAVTEQDIQEIIGSPQQAEKMVSNISGKAVDMIQQRIDMLSYVYMSNLAKAMKRCGQIWLSMAKDLYVEDERIMRYVADDKKIKPIQLMKPIIDKDTGVLTHENNVKDANLDVSVDVGPSSSSKKSATVRALTGMVAIADDPETKQVLLSMAMLNMEGEGIQDIRDYFRKRLVRAGVIKPTEEEMQALQAEMQNQPPDSQAMLLNAMAEEANAKASKARADTMETMASADLKRAQTVKTLQETGLRRQAATVQPSF